MHASLIEYSWIRVDERNLLSAEVIGNHGRIVAVQLHNGLGVTECK